MDTIKTLIDRAKQLKADRSNWESRWQNMADYVRPLRAEILSPVTADGARRGTRLRYSSLAIWANEQWAGGIYSSAINEAQTWGELAVMDPELMERGAVRDYLGICTNITLRSFGPGQSGFYADAPEMLMDLGALGTGAMFSILRPDRRGFIDQVVALKELLVDVNEYREVDTAYRLMMMRAGEAEKRWGDKLSAKARATAKKNPGQEIEILHAVVPNREVREGAFGPDGLAWHSIYAEVDGALELERDGYHEFPFDVPRWAVAPGELYGRGPGELADADIRMLNAMRRSNINAAERVANPTLIAGDERNFSKIRTTAGAVNFGGINPRGGRMIDEMYSPRGIPIGIEYEQRVAEDIKERFAVALLSLQGRTGLADDELFERQRERFRQLAPGVSRLQREWLGPAFVRRYKILAREGAYPPPPPELEGQELDVIFTSPMAQALRAEEAAGTIRTVRFTTELAQIKPEAIDALDEVAAIEAVAGASGTPAGVVRSREDIAKLREQRAAAQQAQAALQAGEQGAGIAEKLARAGQARGGE